MKPFRNLFVLPAILLAMLSAGCASYRAKNSTVQPPNPEAALNELRSGNARFVKSHRTHSTDTRHDADERHKTAKEQHPFTAVLGCSDSRVCPEFIFDQGPGCIFEVRNAGNVVDEEVLASLEYAVEHLHVPLVVVMGHKGCGAVKAVCEAGEKPLPHHLHAFQDHMKGIRRQVLAANHRHDAEVVNRLAEENARQQALSLPREIPFLKEAMDRGDVRLVYALYDMETGQVTLSDLADSGRQAKERSDQL
jgi:carbonic anhydrase